MNKEPFIINISDKDLPNLAQDTSDSFGFEYNKTNFWQEDNLDMLRLMNAINEKMDVIVRLLQKNTKEKEQD